MEVPGQEGPDDPLRSQRGPARFAADVVFEARDSQECKIAENDDYYGARSAHRFHLAADGDYQVHIRDTQECGGQAYYV